MVVSRPNSEEFIDNIVEAFYKKATTDVIIGYHFRKIALKDHPPSKDNPLKPPIEAFSHHLPRIGHFWKNQLLGTPLPKSENPFKLFEIHRELLVRKGEINRWITLFHEVLNDDKSSSHVELKSQWRDKLTHFQGVFLESKILFPKN